MVSQSPDGDGIRVVDRQSNREIINTNREIQEDDEDDEAEEQVVQGLLEWLDKKKKKKKKEKGKGKKKDRQPLILPVVPEKHERKEIHIHINNHIKKYDNHKKQQPKHKKHGGYEDYHEGHYGHDYHDKHYQGKHSYPLLGHHLHLDHYEAYGGGHYGGQHDHHEDYSGYESKKVARYVPMKQRASSSPRPVSRS